MLALKVVAEVRRLLAEDMLSQRKIARLLRISRGTVAAIASGKRPDYELRQDAAENQWEEPSGPPVRCPDCGGMVYMPCLLCRARKARVGSRRPVPRDSSLRPAESVELNLRPEHFARYQEVRAWRFAGAAIGTEETNVALLAADGTSAC